MSSKAKKGSKKEKSSERKPATMPAAGLLTFYEEDIGGIKIRPEIVVVGTFLFVMLVILAHAGVFGS
ncbi:MAG: preprotein translocase subunit Sec61beta [Thermofilum sp.]|uniref:preprotein translocase subunit Sec61beta n=1 Tax=Thermofilum sp. TaxID=1961369 RepID=UPI0031666BD9